MCRLFGFRSVLESQVHKSLLSADNALAVQSAAHPDGWGVAYYVAGAPHVLKSVGAARHNTLFQRVGGIMSSQTVLAHIRKATQGELSMLNCHPFQHGRWVMAHNGDVPSFSQHRAALMERVAPLVRRYILGDTDSELIFHLFLTHLSDEAELTRRGTPLPAVVRALRRTVALVREVCDGDTPAERSLLTLMVTDGELLAAHQGGRELHFSTYKARCPERTLCPFFSPECEAPPKSGHVNHLILTSEPLQGENIWTPLREGEIAAVDHAMRFVHLGAAEGLG